jgi:adenine-specific DNA-methyltransferase
MDKLKMHSPDLSQDNIAKIRALFPDCVTEAADDQGTVHLAVDFDQLRQLLADHIVEGPQERYRLDWPGKREALLTANAPIAKTLRPCRDDSVNFDTTQNLFIEGDNLDALKLLQESYLGKVKLIYIDPPYNTGSDFIYEDDFAEGYEEYLIRSNQSSDEGKLVANTDGNGRFHSDWLSMMYSRLKLARNLLASDGAIFTSIDDNESSNLKRLLDEVFGEQNFIDTIAIEMSTTSGPKTVNAQQGQIVKNVEFVHIYRKSEIFDQKRHLPLLDGIVSFDTHYSAFMHRDGTISSLTDELTKNPKILADIERYNLIDRGLFSIKNIDKLLAVSGPANAFIEAHLQEIARVDRPPVSAEGHVTEVGHWIPFEVDHRTYFLTTLANGTLQALMPLSLNFRMSDDYRPRFGRSVIRGDLWKGFHQDMGNVAKEGGMPFPSGKKPVRLISQLIKWANNSPDGIVLDFFAGSGTTAHAVMAQNASDGGNRKFILVQLPEPINISTKEGKAAALVCEASGLKSVLSEMSKERVRRAGASILEGQGHKDWNRDIGFRVLKIDSSNMTDVYYRADEVKQDELFGQVDSVKPDRTAEDLLFQVLIDWGVGLTLPISCETLHGKTVYSVDGDALIACFETDVTGDLVKDIAARAPLRAVFRDTSFAHDADRINAEQLFRQLSPSTELKAI